MPLGATRCAPASAWATACGVTLQRGVVLDVTSGRSSTPAMAVVGVLAQAQVGHDHADVADLGAQVGQGELRAPRPMPDLKSLR